MNKCYRCGEAILDRDVMKISETVKLHEACTRCQACGSSLGASCLVGNGGALYCSGGRCLAAPATTERTPPTFGRGVVAGLAGKLPVLRKRTVFTSHQREQMDLVFKVNPNPGKETLEKLANLLGLPCETVANRFRNQRANRKGKAVRDEAAAVTNDTDIICGQTLANDWRMTGANASAAAGAATQQQSGYDPRCLLGKGYWPDHYQPSQGEYWHYSQQAPGNNYYHHSATNYYQQAFHCYNNMHPTTANHLTAVGPYSC